MDEIVFVNPNILSPHPDRQFAGTTLHEDDGKYKLIKESIQADGISDPVKVQRGTNVIIGGHTRFRIALGLNLSSVPVRYYDVDDDTARFMMVMDNHKRIGDEKDPIKLAWTFRVVVDSEGLTHGGNRRKMTQTTDDKRIKTLDEIAAFFDMKKRHFSRYLELLRLIPELQALVSQLKIGVKSGSILSKLSPENQRKVFESIPFDTVQRADYRLTENEARSFVDAYGPSRDHEIAAEHDGLDSVLVTDDEEFYFTEDTESENMTYRNEADENAHSIVDDVKLLLNGGERKGVVVGKNEIDVAASNFVEEGSRKEVLRCMDRIDDEHEVNGEEKWRVVDSSKELARQIVLIEDVDKRTEFAQKQLEAAITKEASLLERFETELLAWRVIVGDDMDQELQEKWNALCEKFGRVYQKMIAVPNENVLDVHEDA